jgi:hypothetical protein
MDRQTVTCFVFGALLIAFAMYLSRRSTFLAILIGFMGFYIALLPVTLLYFPNAPLREVLLAVFAN